MSKLIAKEDILTATDGGRRVIEQLCPDANFEQKKKPFKLRNESTASAYLYLKDGIWYVTDFGDEAKALNCFDLWIKLRGGNFGQAVREISAHFGLDAQARSELFAPRHESEPLKNSRNKKKEGDRFYQERKDGPTQSDLMALGRYATAEALELLNCTALEYTATVKDGKIHYFYSTDNYPQFLFDYGSFKKIYKPNEQQKEHRFTIIGEKPAYHLCNRETVAEMAKDPQNLVTSGDGRKLPLVVIVCGERDAVNVCSAGYTFTNDEDEDPITISTPVVWLNSEAQLISHEDVRWLQSVAHRVVYLRDLDPTGKKQAFLTGTSHLDICHAVLPEALSNEKDWRGKPCKDVTDFLRKHKPYELRRLLATAKPYRFWDRKVTYDRNGQKKSVSYAFNNTNALFFLNENGFWKYRAENEKAGFQFIRVQGNEVQEVLPIEIKDFIRNFVETRYLGNEIENLILRTTQLSEGSLLSLPSFRGNFQRGDRTTQYFFCGKKVFQVKPGSITEVKSGTLDRYVWKDASLQKGDTYKVNEKKFFNVQWDDSEQRYKLDLLRFDHPFQMYMIGLARSRWVRQFKAKYGDAWLTEAHRPFVELQKNEMHSLNGPGLSVDEIREQEAHYINNCAALGYLLHHYQERGKDWFVYVMDDHMESVADAHGGTGKSTFIGALRYFCKTRTLEGRNHKLTDNQHVLENLTKSHNLIFIDDMLRGFNMGFWFTKITGDIDVNPKHSKQFTLSHDEKPKICGTANYPPHKRDDSTERRLWYVAVSNWYHAKGEFVPLKKGIEDDIQGYLFKDFTGAQWNDFANFMMECVELYLRIGKTEPPMRQVEKSHARSVMGDKFFEFAEGCLPEFIHQVESGALFTKDSAKPERYVKREDLLKQFVDLYREKTWNIHRLTQAVKAWCKFHGLTLNPEALQNTQGRVFHPSEKNVECFYILRDLSILHTDDREGEMELSVKDPDEDGLPF